MKVKSLARYFFDRFSKSKDGAKTKTEACLRAYREVFLHSEAGELILADLMRHAGMDKQTAVSSMRMEDLIAEKCNRNFINYILSICDITEIEFLEKLKRSKEQ
jgi:hypothetical protein